MQVRDKAKKLQMEKQQLQRETKQMDSEIRALKEMRESSCSKPCKQEKKELQDIIAEKESELRET